MFRDVDRHLLIAKVNVITESKKHTVLTETFSFTDMKLKYSLPKDYLDLKKPTIFQIVYDNSIRTYIFNVYGNVSSTNPTIVSFTKESLDLIHHFINEAVLGKKAS